MERQSFSEWLGDFIDDLSAADLMYGDAETKTGGLLSGKPWTPEQQIAVMVKWARDTLGRSPITLRNPYSGQVFWVEKAGNVT